MRTGILAAVCAVLGAVSAEAATVTVDSAKARLQRRADAMMGIMGFQVIPDITTTSLSVNDPTADSPDLIVSQLGAGFTISESFPLYLEGMLAYGRYDPRFVANDGAQLQEPVRPTEPPAAPPLGDLFDEP